MTGERGSARPSEPHGPEAGAALRAVGELLVTEEPGGAAGGAADRLAAACRGAGRALAVAGVPLGDALDALAAEWASVMGNEPGFAAVRSFADAWGDGTLAWLHRLDCTDPLTGLVGSAHLRTRVGEVLRGRAQGSSGEPVPALVVADLRPGRPPASAGAGDALVDALLVARAGTMVRSVFPGAETPASLGGPRLALLAGGGPWLPRRAALLERMLATIASPEEPAGRQRRRPARVRVHTLPADTDEAHLVLEGLLGSTSGSGDTAERT